MWCDSDQAVPSFIESNLTKNEAIDVAQKHDMQHPNHILRIEETKRDPHQNTIISE